MPGFKTTFRAGFIAARNDSDGKIPEGMLAKLNTSLENSQKSLDEYEKIFYGRICGWCFEWKYYSRR